MALELHGTTGVSLVQDDAGMPPGTPLQVVSVHKSDTFSYYGLAFYDVTGLSVSITPSSTNSKILVTGQINVGGTGDFIYMRLLRGSTAINVGDAASNRPLITGMNPVVGGSMTYGMEPIPICFLDSPSTTSATTYKIQMRSGSSGSNTVYVNRTHIDRDAADYEPRAASSLTLMEIAQ